jgi:hypothetical protein
MGQAPDSAPDRPGSAPGPAFQEPGGIRCFVKRPTSRPPQQPWFYPKWRLEDSRAGAGPHGYTMLPVGRLHGVARKAVPDSLPRNLSPSMSALLASCSQGWAPSHGPIPGPWGPQGHESGLCFRKGGLLPPVPAPQQSRDALVRTRTNPADSPSPRTGPARQELES